ncbi:MAG TPA: hypothetical protein VFZ16_14540, partial [Hyphomicrobiaceae bacterium]|nr:hypothetical protein [Hyphomicrobiaceae bacterium]
MRLTSPLIQRTLSQFEAQAIPDNHPSMPELNRTFGDHTFFIDADGLNIVELTVETDDGHEAGQVMRVASWQDANRTSLVAHPPEP